MTAEDGEKVKEKGESEGVDEEIHYRTDCLRAKAKRPSYLYAKVQESSAIDAHRVPRCFPFCAENRAGASCGVGISGSNTAHRPRTLHVNCRVCHEAHFFPTADASTDAGGKCR